MRHRALTFAFGLAFAACFAPADLSSAPNSSGGAHRFSFVSIEGKNLPLSQFAGRTLLIVNTASRCGYTPQYEGLQTLWETYRERGLVVLGVPSNDFGGQEPGSESQIKEFCEVNFKVDFPLTAKAQVKGPDAHPFYAWALGQLGPLDAPRWNFHKYLVGPDGKLAGSFASDVEPLSPRLKQAVERLLPRPAQDIPLSY
jgi:glutathione peroxidase